LATVISPDRPQPTVHKHVQVREYVRALIADAAPGTAAPSERDLVHRFGVARMTVRQALDALVAEGLLKRVPGRGTFVLRVQTGGPARLTTFGEEMERRGMTASSRTLFARMEAAGPGVARALDVEVGANVVHWQRLRLGDGLPLCVDDTYLADSVVPGFLEMELPESLYAELNRRDLLPTWGEDTITAAAATPEEAGLLGVEESSPVLQIKRRALADSIVVQLSRSTYRPDRFSLWIQLARPVLPA
jgi:GntR family transcriptional regulator